MHVENELSSYPTTAETPCTGYLSLETFPAIFVATKTGIRREKNVKLQEVLPLSVVLQKCTLPTIF